MAPNTDFDQSLLNFLTQSYREAVAHTENYADDIDEIEEQLYGIVADQNWGKLWKLVEQKEDELDVNMSKIRKFLDTLDDEEILKAKQDAPVTRDMDESTAQALKLQLRGIDENEALAYTPEPVGIDSLFELHENAYEELGKKIFVISEQREFDGRISIELTATKQKFEVMKVLEDANGDLHYQHFGQPVPNKGFNVKTSHTQSFFVYKFLHDNEEYLLFSEEKLEPMRAKVSGTHFKINDRKEIGESRTLPVNQDVIFCHTVEPAITKMDSEVMDGIKEKASHEWLAEKLLGGFRHPEWFEKMMLSLLSVKDENGYPSHVMWLAPPGTGKSYFLECLNRSLDEPAGIQTGEGSTMKGLIPSFKDQPPKEGHLLESQRVALVDEKFNLLSNSVRNSDTNLKDAFRPMLSLLEHTSRTFSSGNGQIRGVMNSMMIGVGNPSYGIKNLAQAVEKLDPAYLSRAILYQQTEQHIEYVQERKNVVKKKYPNEEDAFPEFDAEFVSLIDTLREDISVAVDYDRLDELEEELEAIVPATFTRQIYRARYDHHLENLVTGIAKMNTLIEGREEFEARDKDYDEARHIMELVIGSWGGSIDLEEISLNSRPYYLKDELRRIYEQVRSNPGIEGRDIETDSASKTAAVNRLKQLGLVVEVEGAHYPYFHDEAGESGNFEKVVS